MSDDEQVVTSGDDEAQEPGTSGSEEEVSPEAKSGVTGPEAISDKLSDARDDDD